MLNAATDLSDVYSRLSRITDRQEIRASRFEHQWKAIKNRHLVSWYLLNWSIGELRFLCVCAYQLIRIEMRLRIVDWRIRRGQRAGIVSRDLALFVGREFGDTAKCMFRLADDEQKAVIELTEWEIGHFLGVRILRWSKRKRSQHHEWVGCVAEDAAESLALSASPSFVDLVRCKLDELEEA